VELAVDEDSINNDKIVNSFNGSKPDVILCDLNEAQQQEQIDSET